MTYINKNFPSIFAIFLFLIFTIWWLFIFASGEQSSISNQLFSASYGLMALYGAIFGIFISMVWGGFRSLMGRAILMFSFGLLAQEFGQIAYSYYLYFLDIEIPYPSLGDIGYFGSILLYIYGVILIGKISGVKVSISSYKAKIQAFIIPLLMLALGYYLFLKEYQFDWMNPLKIILDFGYPLGQAIYISIAILAFLLSRGLLGGIMKSKILFILFALFVQFLADYTFLYQASQGTVYAGGLNDYIYLVAYLLMTLAILQLKTVLHSLKNYN